MIACKRQSPCIIPCLYRFMSCTQNFINLKKKKLLNLLSPCKPKIVNTKMVLTNWANFTSENDNNVAHPRYLLYRIIYHPLSFFVFVLLYCFCFYFVKSWNGACTEMRSHLQLAQQMSCINWLTTLEPKQTKKIQISSADISSVNALPSLEDVIN